MASLEREIHYLGHDNENAFQLKYNGSAVDLSGTTAMKLRLGDVVLLSTNGTDQAMTWNKAGYTTGETRIHLHTLTTLTGNYDCQLVVFDSASTDGIVWGDTIPLTLKISPLTT